MQLLTPTGKESRDKNAYIHVRRAIQYGILPKLDGSIGCLDCQNPAKYYYHRDGALPLKVEPLCRRCMNHRGRSRWWKFGEPYSLNIPNLDTTSWRRIDATS